MRVLIKWRLGATLLHPELQYQCPLCYVVAAWTVMEITWWGVIGMELHGDMEHY